MTFKNNVGPLLCYFKLYTWFHSHRSIQTVVCLETTKWGQNLWFFMFCVTLKFDGWPWKTIRHLFYATSRYVHHFLAICELKLELQSKNVQFRSKIFCLVWPWNLMAAVENDLKCKCIFMFLQTKSCIQEYKKPFILWLLSSVGLYLLSQQKLIFSSCCEMLGCKSTKGV